MHLFVCLSVCWPHRVYLNFNRLLMSINQSVKIDIAALQGLCFTSPFMYHPSEQNIVISFSDFCVLLLDKVVCVVHWLGGDVRQQCFLCLVKLVELVVCWVIVTHCSCTLPYKSIAKWLLSVNHVVNFCINLRAFCLCPLCTLVEISLMLGASYLVCTCFVNRTSVLLVSIQLLWVVSD